MRMLWWLRNPTWTIREEFTWEFWWIYNSAWTIWKKFTWEIYGDSIFKNEIFRRNSGENAVLTLLSNMSYQGGVHDSVIHSGRGYDKMLWWINSATWAIWKEFTWECYAISSSKISHSGGVHENICGDSTVQDDPLIQVKFTWECDDDSIVQHESFSLKVRDNAVMIP